MFGPKLEHGEQHYQDWAGENCTCARSDLVPPLDHPHYGDPYLRRPIWDGKLFFGGSERAGYAGGYMEGALDAARRRLRSRSALMPRILKSFDGLIQSLLDFALDFNRTSCALSNFPAEAKPSKDYVQAILRDIAAAWKEFCLSVNAYFILRTPAPATLL